MANRRRSTSSRITSPTPRTTAAERCWRHFLHFFPDGFRDETYLDWERGYKAEAHAQWQADLGPGQLRALIRRKEFAEIAARAVRIESRTNLLFSFEKMALRDAVRMPGGAEAMARGLYTFLHGTGDLQQRFTSWCGVVGSLPRRQTRVLTWPVVTVFGFIAQPDRHVFLKPNVTRVAAWRYGYEFEYRSVPNWDTYRALLDFVAVVRRDIRDLRPRDMLDLQSYLWVQGSDEYSQGRFRAVPTTRVRRG